MDVEQLRKPLVSTLAARGLDSQGRSPFLIHDASVVPDLHDQDIQCNVECIVTEFRTTAGQMISNGLSDQIPHAREYAVEVFRPLGRILVST